MGDPSRTDYGAKTIVNVGEVQWQLVRTYGMYLVPACLPGARCATLKIEGRVDRADIGDKRFSEFYFSARDIAADLVSDLLDHGVFVAAGDEPTDAEIEAAGERLSEFYRRQVSDADQDWSRTHNWSLLSDVQRRAARWLGVSREWLFQTGDKRADCPACGEKIKPNVAVCPHCTSILDREKAASFGLLPAVEPASGGDEAGKRRVAARR